MKRVIAVGGVVVLIAAITTVAVWVISIHRTDEIDTSTNKQIPVTAVEASPRRFRDDIHAVGTLKAKQISPLSPKVAGNVKAVFVDIGDRVDRDDVVVRLDSVVFELAVKQAEAALAASDAAVSVAQAQFDEVEKEYRRVSSLLEQKVIPQSRYDAVEATYKRDREKLVASVEQRKQAQATLETARQHLRDADIRSPITGVVVERGVDVGEAVAPGSEVLRIIDDSSLKADIDLPEADYASIKKAMPAQLTADAIPGEVFRGEVSVRNRMVQRETRTFRVRILLSNEDGRLVDGMYVRVMIPTAERESLAIPRAALQRLPGSGTYFVFVLGEDSKVSKRLVTIGTMENEYAEVLDGLSEGESVVTNGAGRLRSGDEVAVLRGSETVKDNKP